MTSPNAAPTRVGSASTVWLALTCVVLLATAILHLVWVLPVFASTLASVGSGFSLPARIAFRLAQFGLVLGIFGGAVFGLYVWYRKAPGRRERLDTALAVTAFVLALYVGLMSWAYVDVAIHVAAPRPAAAVPQP